MPARILVADDDPVICGVLSQIVEDMGHTAELASTAAETVKAVSREQFDIVLLDLRFPDRSDLSTLSEIREKSPSTDVIMVTAEADDLRIVAEAVRLGAFDYVPKPIREDDIRIRVTRAVQSRSLARSQRRAVAELARGRELDDIVGGSAAIKAIVRRVKELSSYDIPVLILGETGTGKELIARALHYGGDRREKPFVSVNCAALPGELTESELFGHEKGAFTGAHSAKRGAFEEAEDGTLFLDEIGDMELGAQASLLQVLERGEFRSVGGKAKRNLARLVIATNQDLDLLIEGGRFRKDLFYRINRARIVVTPLRDRKEDIPPLAQHFLALMERKVGKGVLEITPQAMAGLRRYDWPGNVREMRNEIERAYIHATRSALAVLDLSPEIVAVRTSGNETDLVEPQTIETIQKLVEALRTTGGRIGRAAEVLGVHRNTVRRWMNRYGLTKEQVRPAAAKRDGREDRLPPEASA